MINRDQHIHFIGIGGIGMSAIAQILLELGYSVSGSDARASAQLDLLALKKGRVYVGHRTEQVGDADIVVASSAIRVDNPEYVAAKERGIPIWQRARMLAELLAMGRAVTIAGTHGKTTTTSMVALVFEMSGLDPTAIIGGELNDLGGNAKLGYGGWVIAEADESDGSFLHYHPHISVVTNVDRDHVDYYKDEAAIESAFETFLRGTQPEGVRIVGIDSEAARRINDKLEGRAVTYAVGRDDADYTARDIRKSPTETVFVAVRRGNPVGEIHLRVPGLYNVANSLAALAAADEAAIEFDKTAKALATFTGAKRRFELKGVANDIRVFDDYAHHPVEIAATLSGLADRATGRRVGVFQPHRYSRTLEFKDDFARALSNLDLLILLDVYSAGEPPIEGVSGELIYDATSNKERVHYLGTLDRATDYLVEHLAPGDTLITMGAGDVWRVGERVINALKK